MRRALIAGGSLGGLFAANMLHRAGWDVLVLERVGSALSGRGAGIVTHPELFDCLRQGGVTVDDSIGVAVPGRVTLAQDGSVAQASELPQILTAWGRLYHLLKDALPAHCYRLGAALQMVEQDAAGVTVRLADGGSERAELLVAADGFRSTVRAQFLPDCRLDYAGYVAWRGLTDEAALSTATHAALFERFAFCLPPSEQMLGYPVAGEQDEVAPGLRRFNYVWYRPADADTTLRDMLTDTEGRCHADGIPPGLIRPDVRQQMLLDASRVLAPQFTEVVHKAKLPFFQPIFDLEVPHMAFGRVALLGDAAFVVRPHCGMGVTKAGADALALVQALAREPDVAAALRGYEQQRVAFGRFIVGHARHLGAYMQAQQRTPEEREMAERYRSVAAVMRETAVAPAYPASA
ncbi:FAD binding domain-containing protein [Ferrovibrio sp.]|uniref:FAD binding domain-containing protein n=1 Tax=Ferrovibrio sp. TaxID=1917215 RepID=UPI001B54C5F0|nr:FAD binding domain-containing protein [Ferrovibrio sp.]MBP7063844.1 FAD binding domain-containing protein [Ferrovibrio sp.]